jgi:hypothetical protein
MSKHRKYRGFARSLPRGTWFIIASTRPLPINGRPAKTVSGINRKPLGIYWYLTKDRTQKSARQDEENSAVPLYGYADRSIVYCREALGILPVHGDFADEFSAITRTPEFPGVPGTYNPLPPHRS